MLLASARSVGKVITHKGRSWTVQEAKPEAFQGLDLVFFSAGAGTSKELCPAAVEAGAVVVDNSSAFRMDESVPLVVPEVNPHAVRNHRGIIANPNCSTAIALMGLTPLHRSFGLQRFVACTYQAVSGSGVKGMVELEDQVRSWSRGETATPRNYPHPIAFNLFPHVDSFQVNGYTKEELKMLNEGRKILELPELQVSTTVCGFRCCGHIQLPCMQSLRNQWIWTLPARPSGIFQGCNSSMSLRKMFIQLRWQSLANGIVR